MNPTKKIRPPIDLKFIMNNFTAIDEQAPQVDDVLIHHSPIHHPSSLSSSRKDRVLEQMQQMQ